MYWHFPIFVPFNLIIESSVEVDAHNLQFGFNFTAWGKNVYHSHLKKKKKTNLEFLLPGQT